MVIEILALLLSFTLLRVNKLALLIQSWIVPTCRASRCSRLQLIENIDGACQKSLFNFQIIKILPGHFTFQPANKHDSYYTKKHQT
jgi:hypothetical protein